MNFLCHFDALRSPRGILYLSNTLCDEPAVWFGGALLLLFFVCFVVLWGVFGSRPLQPTLSLLILSLENCILSLPLTFMLLMITDSVILLVSYTFLVLIPL